MLARIPKRSTTILSSSQRRPWTKNGFETGFIRAKTRAGIEGLRFHDLRGSAATNFCLADIGKREIAEIMAWEEKTVDRIIKRYVGRSAATKALILKLNKAERRT